MDAAGRLLSGPQPFNTSIGYVYDGSYRRTARFGYNGNGTPISASTDRFEATLFQYASGTVGNIDASYEQLGGWTIDVHHVLDPQTGTVYLGDGKRQPGSSALTNFAGTGQEGHSGDSGQATSARIDLTAREGNAVAVSPAGDVYFTEGVYVRKIDTDGIITTVAGNGSILTLSPSGIALSPNGDLYIADSINCRLQKLDASSTLTIVAGASLASPNCVDRTTSSDGPADPSAPGAATFTVVRKLAFAPDGTLYIAERQKLRRLRDGQVSTVATASGQLYGVAVAADGTPFVSDSTGGKILVISTDGVVSTYAGGGASTADGVPAKSARLDHPQDVALGPDGLVYFVDTFHNQVRRIHGDGTIQTVAGTGAAGRGGDGHPTATELNTPGGLAFGPDGSLFILDSENHLVRKISPKTGVQLAGGAFGVPSLDGQQLYRFDGQGRHLSTIDTHTGAALYTFDYSNGVLTSIATASGRLTKVTRADGTITITAPDQQPTTLSLDSENKLEQLTRPDGTFYTFGYGADGLLASLTDPKANAEAGLPAVFQYQDGLLVADTDARASATPQTLERSLLAGTMGWSVTHTTPSGRATDYRTELSGGVRIRTITHPDLTQSIQRRREDGALVFPAPGRTLYDQHVTRPDGTQVWSRSQRNPAYGGATNLLTDQRTQLPSSLARIVSQSAAATIDPTTGALPSETITTTINGKPASTVSFDAVTRTFTSTTAAGRSSSTVLDAAGRTSRVAVAGIANATDFQYDSAGRLTRITHGARTMDLGYFPAGSALKAGYLQSTQTYTSASPPLSLTTFDRDALGRVLQSTTGSATTRATWDANDNLASVTPPGKPTHTLTYDAINQLTRYMPPVVPGVASPGTSYGFDLDRNVDIETRPGNVRLAPAYDTAGRLDTVALPGGLLDYEYYPVGTPSGAGKTSAIRGPYAVDLHHTHDGSLTTSTTWSGDVTGSVAWQYNDDFLATTETVTPGTGPAVGVSFGYDADNLTTCASLTSCAPPAADALGISRSPSNGLIGSINLGSVAETYGYNAYGELASQSSAFSTTPLITLSYDTAFFPRDALGRIKRKSETIAGVTTNFDYTYDLLGRLTDVSRDGVLEEHFEYDDNGNRTLGYSAADASAHAGSYDAQDRLVSYGPWTFTYAPNGELATRTSGGRITTYAYDALGNLLSVALPGGTTLTYLVDGQNRRVGKRVNGVLTQQWLYKDTLRPLAELDGSGALVARFVYASGRNVPDFVIRGGNTYRVLADQLGSPRMAVNVANSNDVPFLAEYSSFGAQTMLKGAADWMPFGFAGGMYDADTGVVRFGARDYDALTGRWTAKDPIRFHGGQENIYVYVWNNPVNLIDPSGKILPLAAGAIIGGSAVAGAAAEYLGGGGVEGAIFGAAAGTLTGVGVVSGSGLLVGLGIGAAAIRNTAGGRDPGGLVDTLVGCLAGGLCGAFTGPAAPFACPFAEEAGENVSAGIRQ